MSTIRRLASGFATDRRISLDEAQQLVAEAKKNGISTYDKGELKKVLQQFQSQFDPAALQLLADIVGGTTPAPTPGPNLPTAGGRVTALAPSGSPPVFISDAGVLTAKADGSPPASAKESAEAAYRAAALVDDAPDNLFKGLGLSSDVRGKLFDRLSADLSRVAAPGSGLEAAQALQARSSLGTVMRGLLEATPEPALQEKMLGAYEALARGEPDARLRENLVFHLANSPVAKAGKGKAVADALMSQLAPSKPPYEKWFAGGNKTVNLSWTVGQGEFFKGFAQNLKNAGFKPVGPEGAGTGTYEKTVNKPGVGETTFRISVREGGTNILAPMNDPNVQVVGYDGHSNWGRNMTASVRNGPDSADGADGKLLFYNLCVGKGVLDRVKEKYGNAQVVTTYAASNFYTDSSGQMTRGEGVQGLLALVDGISARADWQALHVAMNKAANIGHGRTWDNVITPISTLTREKVLDRDNDGQADYLDKHFNYDTVNVAEDTRREFTPVKQPRPASVLDGTKVLVGANMINTLSEFSAILDRVNPDSKVVPNGWFEPKLGETDLVKFEPAKGPNGKPEFRMSVNARYAHASEEMLRMVTVHEFNRWLAESGQLRMDPVDAKLAGVIVAAQSLKVDDGYRDSEVWTNFLSRFGLPNIPLATVTGILSAEHGHAYAGSLEMVRKLKATLAPEALAALKAAGSGAPTRLVG
jgi:hypothetical protein